VVHTHTLTLVDRIDCNMLPTDMTDRHCPLKSLLVCVRTFAAQIEKCGTDFS
jgi:hypothetical protein